MFKIYHAHIYFTGEDYEKVADLYEEISRSFDVQLGRIHKQPIGPHTRGMFQVIFQQTQFGDLVPWLMANRNNLSILVHADTGDDYRDHTENLLWLGEPLALNLDALK